VGAVITPTIDYEEVSVDYIQDLPAAMERMRAYARFPQYFHIFVDLKHYINLSAPKVDINHSLHRTYMLFRTLGLRHLIVTDIRNRVVGIITRKDLLVFNVVDKLRQLDQDELNDHAVQWLPAITMLSPSELDGQHPGRNDPFLNKDINTTPM